MKGFIPSKVLTGKNAKEVNTMMWCGDESIKVIYLTNQHNDSTRKHFLSLSRKIKMNEETFVVLGLLQAEMGKTNNGCLNFTNSEHKLINKVLRWFDNEFELPPKEWRWYIKLNMQEPEDETYKRQVEEKVIDHWIAKTAIAPVMRHPKDVVYKKDSKRTRLKEFYYGALIVEYKHNLMSQIIKNLVKKITYERIIYSPPGLMRAYLRGIIAGESTIELFKPNKRYRVYISATQEKEMEIYLECLNRLGIGAKIYPPDKVIISRRDNNIQLLKQRLMTLHPRKYNKFLNMMKQYPDINHETGYFMGKKNVWNKISQVKVDEIVEIYNSGVIKTKEIAEKVGVSQIKVQRVLKEHHLGKRLPNAPEEKRKQIAIYAQQHPEIPFYEIANSFNVHPLVVSRASKFRQ